MVRKPNTLLIMMMELIKCGKIYEELIKNKKVNTKLKKYDKIIQRHIKKGVEEEKVYTFPVANTGMNSDIRKFLNKIMYG